MNKIIIQNNSRWNDSSALTFVDCVIQKGKVSKYTYGMSYCAVTLLNQDTLVSCELRKSGTIKFTVEDYKGEKQRNRTKIA